MTILPTSSAGRRLLPSYLCRPKGLSRASGPLRRPVGDLQYANGKVVIASGSIVGGWDGPWIWEVEQECIMDFRLTYAGALKASSNSGSKNSRHKHEIRRHIHKQLKRLWEIHPYLSQARYAEKMTGNAAWLLKDSLAAEYERVGYNFVPLVTPRLSLICSISVLLLRPGIPGAIIKGGDIDNRLKTLFDALRIPENKGELGGYETAQDDEKPFFCLLSNDDLIAHISLETDTLLEPTGGIGDERDADARLVISVNLKPFDVGWHNISFG